MNDGVPLTLDIYRPTSPGSHPAIVEIYGGGWQRGAPADNVAFDSYLATHGYVVFAIDYRHSPQWRWPAQLSDVRAALEWIARHGTEYDADPSRLAVVGRSSGAQLAMVAAYARGGPPISAYNIADLPQRGGYDLACKVMGLPRGTVSALVSQGRIPFYRLGRKIVVFDRDELDAWLKSGAGLTRSRPEPKAGEDAPEAQPKAPRASRKTRPGRSRKSA